MLSRKLLGILPLAGTLAGIPAASHASSILAENTTQYRPIQSISSVFGSKSMSGYFVREAATCVVTLMIAEQGDTEEVLAASPVRIRLVLHPGQIAGLDSEEGRSLNVTCGADATSLIVDTGDRATLEALQVSPSEKVTAEVP